RVIGNKQYAYKVYIIITNRVLCNVPDIHDVEVQCVIVWRSEISYIAANTFSALSMLLAPIPTIGKDISLPCTIITMYLGIIIIIYTMYIGVPICQSFNLSFSGNHSRVKVNYNKE